MICFHNFFDGTFTIHKIKPVFGNTRMCRIKNIANWIAKNPEGGISTDPIGQIDYHEWGPWNPLLEPLKQTWSPFLETRRKWFSFDLFWNFQIFLLIRKIRFLPIFVKQTVYESFMEITVSHSLCGVMISSSRLLDDSSFSRSWSIVSKAITHKEKIKQTRI